jgi:hypothetical protein
LQPHSNLSLLQGSHPHFNTSKWTAGMCTLTVRKHLKTNGCHYSQ